VSHVERIDLVRRTHDIFCGLSGKSITLVASNPPGRTDTEHYVAVPIEDPDVVLIHRHEWSHIFFKSNLHARDAFMERYWTSLYAPENHRDEVENTVANICNALDDVRVNSLWRRLYPASADAISQRWARKLQPSLVDRATMDALPPYILSVDLGIEYPGTRSWGSVKRIIQHAVEMVRGRGYHAVLKAALYILEHVPQHYGIEEVLEPTAPGESVRTRRISRSKAVAQTDQARAAAFFAKAGKPLQSKFMDAHSTSNVDPDRERTRKMLRAVLGNGPSSDLEELIQEEQQEIETISTRLTASVPPSPSETLAKKSPSVQFVTLHSKDVVEQPLSEWDRRTVGSLRSMFMRLMDAKKRKRTDSGEVLDPQRYIDLMLGSGDPDIFIDDNRARGFSAVILVDMSSSMTRLWGAVSRACKMLALSMDFPFSHIEVWGFSGAMYTVMFKFEDTKKGYMPVSRGNDVWTLTPLHNALPVAINRALQLPGSPRHVFLVSDSDPQAGLDILGNTRGKLQQLVREAVAEGRKKKINIVPLVIGTKVPDPVLNVMYGARKWVRVEEEQEDLLHDMVDLVKKVFVNHLRR
jgi:hypothetical protein